MSKKKICFLAQFPPPIHGLSKAVETLYNSTLSNDFELEKIDLKDNKRIFKNLFKMITSKADLFYFTISQTKGGNVRDLFILKILEWRKKKCLVHLHGGFYRKLIDENMCSIQKKLNYRAISKLEGVIVLSESLKSIFNEMIAEEKIFVVPNCVDNNFLMEDVDFTEKLSSLSEERVRNILYLSNFIKTKGYYEVLELARIQKEAVDNGNHKKLHFHFAGKFFSKSEEENFMRFVNDNKLDDFVTYHGVVDGTKKCSLLKECDIFALLTRYPNEGQPISILEAMGNGLTIITTDHAGIPDIVKNGENGIVLKINETIKSLSDLIDDIDFKSVAVTNRKSVLENYQESMYINNMRDCFNKVLLD